MKKGQTHPAAIYSKNALAKSLLELMNTDPYKEITITKLCSTAQISRRTFYRNFRDIDELLVYAIATITEKFSAEIKKHRSEPLQNIFVAFFSFWEENSSTLCLLLKQNQGHILFIEYLKVVFEMPFLCGLPSDLSENSSVKLAFNSGGLWSVLIYWVNSNFKQSPEQLAKMIIL